MSLTSTSRFPQGGILDDKLCNLLQKCETPEAPLCPLREDSVSHGVWYPNEAVCRAKRFQDLPWIKNQVRIVNLRLTMDDGYFTVRMLNSLQANTLTRKLKGADPSCPNAESTWLQQHEDKQSSTPPKRHRYKACSTENLQPQLC